VDFFTGAETGRRRLDCIVLTESDCMAHPRQSLIRQALAARRNKLSVEDGCLRLDSTRLRFNVRGRDIVIRARLKKGGAVKIAAFFARDINNGQDCAGARGSMAEMGFTSGQGG